MLICIVVAKNQFLPRYLNVPIKGDSLILNERASKGGDPKGRSENDETWNNLKLFIR